jgi:hypothetical protein
MVDGRFPGATPKDGVYLRVIFVERDRISHGLKAPGHDWRRRRGAVHEYDAMTWDLFPKDLLCLHLGKAQIAECSLYHPRERASAYLLSAPGLCFKATIKA